MSDQNQMTTGTFIVVLIAVGVGVWFYLSGGLRQQTPEGAMRTEAELAADTEKEYAIAKRSGTAHDAWTKAVLVAGHYLSAKDEANYQKWTKIKVAEWNRSIEEGVVALRPSKPDSPTDHIVTYRVIGSASSASLTYENGQGGTSQEKVDLPWTKQITIKTGTFLYLAAQNQGRTGTMTARIEADGKLVTQSTSSGAYTIANAHASCCEPAADQTAAPASSEAAATAPAGMPTSVEDVQRMVLGTWTYTGQQYTMMGQTFWGKWVFKPDGTMEDYSATASDDNWGQPKTEKWQAVSAKYSDTGKRWYGLKIGGWMNPVVLKDNGNLRFHPSPDVDVEFTKGEKFPFSK